MSLLLRANALSLAQRIEHRRKILRLQEFEILGRLSVVVFDPNGMSLPKRDEPVFQPNLLDWESLGPWLGISADSQDLLIISDVPHPPRLKDTSEYLGGRHYDKSGGFMLGTPRFRMHEQRYSERTALKHKGFLVLQPIQRILLKPKGVADWALINVHGGHDGTQMAFLVNPRTQEGHFIGGGFSVSTAKAAPKQFDAAMARVMENRQSALQAP